MAVTVETLKAELKDYNFEVLTDGDISVAARAIEKAIVWTKAKILAAKGVYRDNDLIVEQIVTKRALYELYSYAENEAVAQDKKEDAMELLRSVYGSAVDGAGYSSGSSGQSVLPAAAFVKPEDS